MKADELKVLLDQIPKEYWPPFVEYVEPFEARDTDNVKKWFGPGMLLNSNMYLGECDEVAEIIAGYILLKLASKYHTIEIGRNQVSDQYTLEFNIKGDKYWFHGDTVLHCIVAGGFCL